MQEIEKDKVFEASCHHEFAEMTKKVPKTITSVISCTCQRDNQIPRDLSCCDTINLTTCTLPPSAEEPKSLLSICGVHGCWL